MDTVSDDISDDEMFDYDYSYNNRSPFPAECINETEGIESFYQCFINRYNSCPTFFYGSLSKACQAAFDSADITEHRLVLVYIHNDNSTLNNIFCKTMFCSEIFIEYLLENYIVWPWDITLESNRQRLSAIWKEIFVCPLLNDFPVDKCPMLFGITRRFPGKHRWLPTAKYQFTSLVKGDRVIRTQEITTRDTLISELITFKEDCDRIEALIRYEDETNNDLQTESFFQYLQQRYQYCPTFFTDSLQNACKLIHNRTLNKECRPVLIYIHDDNSINNRTINPLSIIDYLLEDFIVYPFDITSESNQEILMDMWNKVFYERFSTSIDITKCPLLFGITRLFDEVTNDSIISKYQCKLLLDNDVLTYSKLMRELKIFKEESHANEKALACDFLKNTGFCWDIILEICQYLTLNDIINSFSTKIIPLLIEFQVKVHLSDPSHAFMNMINEKLLPEQIVSIQFNTNYFKAERKLRSRLILENVQNLIFINPHESLETHNLSVCFLNWTNVLLLFNEKVSNSILSKIFYQFPRSLRRLEIRTSVPVRLHLNEMTFNTSIEYFRFDVSRLASGSMGDCMESYISRLLSNFVKFIINLRNIHSVYFVINEFIVEKLLDIDQWIILANSCQQLKKITLKILGNMSPNDALTKTILQIRNSLIYVRNEVRFQVIFSKTIPS
ncbi:hypothetical protein I4U23_015789 [Adineta vaga]|nr:hypothetical protein I4U23_015789 [Adineta vaga]